MFGFCFLFQVNDSWYLRIPYFGDGFMFYAEFMFYMYAF